MITNPEIIISWFQWTSSEQTNAFDDEFVLSFMNFFQTIGYSVKLNSIDAEKGGKIHDFIENYDRSKFFVFIINDKFLHFQATLFELASLSKLDTIYQNVFFLIHEDVKLYNSINLIDYHYYWDDKVTFLKKKIFDLSNKLFQHFVENELELYQKICKVISNVSAFSTTFIINSDDVENLFVKIRRVIEYKIESENELTQIHKKTRFLNHCPFYISKNYIGNKLLLDEINQNLIKNKLVVISSDFKGIGKTTLVKAYLNTEKYIKQFNNCAWISVFDNVLEDIIDQLGTTNNGFSYNQEFDLISNFRILLKVLKDIDGNNLLIIDNVKHTLEIDILINELKSNKWYILAALNDNADWNDALKLNKFDVNDSKQLFYRYYKKEQNDMMLEHLLSNVDYHTLVIEIMAKTANQNSRLNIIKLYEIIKKAKYKNLPDVTNGDSENDNQTDLNIEQAVQNYLEAIIETESFSFDEERFLRFFAVMPAMEIDEKALLKLFQIRKGAESDFCNRLDDIVKRGWLQNFHNVYSIHELVQPVIIKKLKPDTTNCADLITIFIDRIVDISKDNYPTKKIFIQFAERIIQSIRDSDSNLAILAEKVADVYQLIRNNEKCLFYNLKALEIKEKTLNAFHPEIAECCNKISIIYGNTGDYKKDLEYGMKALAIRLKILEPNNPDLAQSYNNIAITYRSLGEYATALNYHLNDIKICEAIYDSENQNLAISYYETSVTYYYLKDYKLAKNYIDKAVQIWQKVLPSDYSDLQNALEIQEIIHRKTE